MIKMRHGHHLLHQSNQIILISLLHTQVIAGLVECAIPTYKNNRPTLAMASCTGHGLLGTAHTCVCKRVVLVQGCHAPNFFCGAHA